MKLAANIFTGLVALIHIYIVILEMFLWQTPYGLATFKLTPEIAATTANLAFNQGAYNGVLAAGLIWSFLVKEIKFKKWIRLFFLGAVFAMGVVGAATVGIKILFVQSIPALLGLIFVLLSKEE